MCSVLRSLHVEKRLVTRKSIVDSDASLRVCVNGWAVCRYALCCFGFIKLQFKQ